MTEKECLDFIKNKFAEYNIALNDTQINQFWIYYNYLTQENNKYNLTAITNFQDVIVKHFVDCSLGITEFSNDSTICDIGAGAGFPSIPLKILNPSLRIIMVDSLNKRVNFLNNTTKLLELNDIYATHSRAEEFLNDTNYRETFDFVTSRAVAPINTLLELTIPALHINGRAIFYKSTNYIDELTSSSLAQQILGTKFSYNKEFQLEDNKRIILVFEKISQTPQKYPRKKNLPRTSPLQP